MFGNGKAKRDAARHAALVAATRAESGRHNQVFREDLMTYLLDYNALAEQNMGLLVGVMTANGYMAAEPVDLAALRLAFRYLCEEAAVFITQLPEEPEYMIFELDAHLDTLVHAEAAPELREARSLMHVLLGGAAVA